LTSGLWPVIIDAFSRENHKFGRRGQTPMARSDLPGRSYHWQFHSAHFWCGLVAGVGLGLLLAAALVELGALATERKAWVSLVGALLVGAGGIVGWRGQPVAESGPN
jgi:hypothetical protein